MKIITPIGSYDLSRLLKFFCLSLRSAKVVPHLTRVICVLTALTHKQHQARFKVNPSFFVYKEENIFNVIYSFGSSGQRKLIVC